MSEQNEQTPQEFLNFVSQFSSGGKEAPQTAEEKIAALLSRAKNKASETMASRKEDLIIGVISEYGIEQVRAWVETLKDTGYVGKKAMLIYNAKNRVIDYLRKEGFVIWAISRAPEEQQKNGYAFWYGEPQSFNVCQERFFHVHQFLRHEAVRNPAIKDANVLMTDVRDVVFQRDPLMQVHEIFDKKPEKSVILSTEAIIYANEPWGKNNIIEAFGLKMFEKLQNNEIFNAGVIAGRYETFVDLLLSVYLVTKGAKTNNGHVPGGGGADQAALNIIINTKPWKDVIKFLKSSDGFSANVGTLFVDDEQKIYKNQANRQLEASPVWDGQQLKTILGRSYSVIHQYDKHDALAGFYRNYVDNKRKNVQS